jgi:hypothetical protein
MATCRFIYRRNQLLEIDPLRVAGNARREIRKPAFVSKEDKMKRTFLFSAVLLLAAANAFAGATSQKWSAGWDSFGEPLNYKTSKVTWSVNSTKKTLTVTFKLATARPNKLYQVGINFFCTNFSATFGNYPVNGGGGACNSITRQGVTRSVTSVELGAVTTDEHGNGTFEVVIGPIAAGSYVAEFQTRDSVGCNLIGGDGNSDCNVDFQSPGPTFGDTTTITIP